MDRWYIDGGSYGGVIFEHYECNNQMKQSLLSCAKVRVFV